jgi:hypothetical protein
VIATVATAANRETQPKQSHIVRAHLRARALRRGSARAAQLRPTFLVVGTVFLWAFARNAGRSHSSAKPLNVTEKAGSALSVADRNQKKLFHTVRGKQNSNKLFCLGQ